MSSGTLDMNEDKARIDLYTEQLMRVERAHFASQKENHHLKLNLMRQGELLELKARYPEEPLPSSKLGKLRYRLKVANAKFVPSLYRIDLTYGARAVFDGELLKMQIDTPSDSKARFSILLDATDGDVSLLRQTLVSVYDQTYDNYELAVTDCSSKKNFHISKLVKNAAKAFGGRLKINTAPEGDFIMSLRPGDFLNPAALRLMADKVTEGTDFIYADEVGFDEYPQNIRPGYPLYEPGYGKAAFTNADYTIRAFAVSKALAEGEDITSGEAGLKLLRKANNPAHVPAVLYYSRGGDIGFKTIPQNAEVQGTPLVSILICNRDHRDILERCISSIEEKTTYGNYEVIVCENGSTEEDIKDYYKKLEGSSKVRVITWEGGSEFNFAALNNFVAKEAKGEYMILLNNDTEVIEPGWIEALLKECQKEDTAVAGSLLLYPDETIQHAGMCILGGNVFHLGMHESADEPGYLGMYSRSHEVSSVTAACMMVRKDVWDELGGLDEAFRIAYNDVDFCLRAREAGYQISYTPYAKLYHHEGKSRGFRRLDDKDIAAEEQERRLFISKHPVTALTDPYYNPNLLPGGLFLERLPNEEDRALAKELMQYKDKTFCIDSNCSPDTARQMLYVSSVILGRDNNLRFTEGGAEDGILITDKNGRIEVLGSGNEGKS